MTDSFSGLRRRALTTLMTACLAACLQACAGTDGDVTGNSAATSATARGDRSRKEGSQPDAAEPLSRHDSGPAHSYFHPEEIGRVEQTAAGRSKAAERVGEDWAEFLGPRGNGISGETGLLEKWPEAGPDVVWKKRIGEGYSAPSVRGSRLVVFHRPGGGQFPGAEEVVDCVEADTGKPLWHYAYPTQYVDPY